MFERCTSVGICVLEVVGSQTYFCLEHTFQLSIFTVHSHCIILKMQTKHDSIQIQT